MKNETYYKAVAVDDDTGARMSYIVTGPLMCTYEPYVWTHRRKYGPFVFGSFEDAWQFVELTASSTYQWELWACEAREAKEITSVLPGRLLNQWANRKVIAAMNDPANPIMVAAPTGSYIASRIRLVERLESFHC